MPFLFYFSLLPFDGIAMNDLAKVSSEIDRVFTEAFGRTPLRERLDDIVTQALSIVRYTDLKNLREESADLLCSLLQLFNECGWNPQDLVQTTLSKIASRRLQYASLGRKTVVALYGGAFNPVTVGHIGVARFVLNASRLFDEVWLMPCYEHMGGKSMASPEHRLEMCRLAAQTDGRIKVFDYEIKNQLRGETYFLTKRLLEEDFVKNQFDLSLIIGLDNANSLPQWPNSAELERLIRFVIVPRKGVESAPGQKWYLKPPHVFLQDENPVVEISSTEVRRLVQARDERVHRFLDQAVLEYIETNALYR
jgi:nicotinate-nucleotide adenylyltransferase